MHSTHPCSYFIALRREGQGWASAGLSALLICSPIRAELVLHSRKRGSWCNHDPLFCSIVPKTYLSTHSILLALLALLGTEAALA